MRGIFAWSSFGLAMAGVGMLATACVLECTLVGCADNVSATFQTALVEPGEYVLTVQTAVGSSTCTFVLPGSGGAGGAGGDASSGSADGSGMQCESTHQYIFAHVDDQGELWFGINFESEDAEDPPTEMTVDLTHEGEMVSEGTYELEYAVDYPNGEQCGPECRQAQVLIE